MRGTAPAMIACNSYQKLLISWPVAPGKVYCLWSPVAPADLAANWLDSMLATLLRMDVPAGVATASGDGLIGDAGFLSACTRCACTR